MNTTLSFRKESIQSSSQASESLSQAAAEFTEGPGQKHAHDRWAPTLTTTLTIL